MSDQPSSKKLMQVVLGAFGLVTLFAFQNCSQDVSAEVDLSEPASYSQTSVAKQDDSGDPNIMFNSKSRSVSSEDSLTSPSTAIKN